MVGAAPADRAARTGGGGSMSPMRAWLVPALILLVVAIAVPAALQAQVGAGAVRVVMRVVRYSPPLILSHYMQRRH